MNSLISNIRSESLDKLRAAITITSKYKAEMESNPSMSPDIASKLIRELEDVLIEETDNDSR